MNQNHIHIVSFNIPYPADYGGVIDVYYKLKALHTIDLKIHLHCFEYGRKKSNELNSVCETVHYYKRKTNFLNAFSLWPYIVKSRISEDLTKNLLLDDYPILLEGIHTTALVFDNRFKNRFIVFRPANIEHEYYFNLAKTEKKLFRKFFHYIEAKKLLKYERKLKNIDLILAISEADKLYFQKQFSNVRVEYIPAFHAGVSLRNINGNGAYAFYHGNLDVAENDKAALFLIENVFSKIDYPLIISGNKPSNKLSNSCKKLKHVQLIENPDNESLIRLIQNAHIHVLPTFQSSGFKLKLIHALFYGRHIITNENMIVGTDFRSICHIADDSESWIKQIEALAEIDFSDEELANRKAVIIPKYTNKANAEKINELIFLNKII